LVAESVVRGRLIVMKVSSTFEGARRRTADLRAKARRAAAPPVSVMLTKLLGFEAGENPVEPS
jgi:hypothetical protein